YCSLRCAGFLLRWLLLLRSTGSRHVAQTASHIIKDMLPGPYPKTSEERAATAKKYNMQVEDYEPWLMMAWGMVTTQSSLTVHSRRGIHGVSGTTQTEVEPSHWDLDVYIRNCVHTSPRPASWNLVCKQLFSFVAFMWFMFWVGENYPTHQPVRVHDPTKEPELVVHYEIWGGFVHPK
uniref:Uncharacterized protein n=1 Tax=Balaenoptera musculus TaxID=9771 RepID=A0A8C0CKE8_BALMU